VLINDNYVCHVVIKPFLWQPYLKFDATGENINVALYHLILKLETQMWYQTDPYLILYLLNTTCVIIPYNSAQQCHFSYFLAKNLIILFSPSLYRLFWYFIHVNIRLIWSKNMHIIALYQLHVLINNNCVWHTIIELFHGNRT